MKKFFQFLGLISLICFSFIFTDTTLDVVKEYDELMVTIKSKKNNYTVKPMEAIIKNNTIIPGINGKEMDINNSYYQMKKIGKFTEKLIVYKNIYQKNRLEDNLNKYIINGNKSKKKISIIFLLKNNVEINKELQVLDKYKIKVNFFIDKTWLDNITELENIVKDGHELGNLGDEESLIIIDTVIKRILNQRKSYCYNEVENEQKLNMCYLQKNYSIIPSLVIKNNFYKNIKNTISNGNIISFEINSELEKSLPIVIDYIKSKGYEIVTLNELLKQDI